MNVTTDNRHVVQHSDVIVLAVKPHVVPLVLEEVNQDITRKKLVVSVAAGVTLQRLQKVSIDQAPVFCQKPVKMQK